MEHIPLRCRDCPYISQILDRLRDLLSEEAILEGYRALVAEAVSEEIIDRRIEQIDNDLADIDRQLDVQFARTVGCAGVVLTQVRHDDEAVTTLLCRSPLS